LGELQTAALIGKALAQDPTVLNAHQCLAMATINGARALGIDERTGSLEPGKAADITAISLEDIGCNPLYDPTSSLIHNNRNMRVSHVWVDGKALLLSGHLQTMNEREIRGKAQQWQRLIAPDNTH
ncbi:MAG TPA: amidohydrolase family protein, partial [Cellvibrionaceae bacterium]